MPGFYLLNIFNYFIVVQTSEELSPIYFGDLKGETSTSNILGEKLPVLLFWFFVDCFVTLVLWKKRDY